MAEDTPTTSGIGKHGVLRLPSVDVDSYNIELKDDDGFLGDRACRGAFRKILDDLRKPLKKNGDDPLGKTPSEEIGKGPLDKALIGEDIEAAALVHGAIEEFAQELAYVTGRFLKTKAWADTECIVVGGGFRNSGVGELAIARAGVLLKGEGRRIDLMPIVHHPDDAGLIGAAHLMPAWMLKGNDAILAVDIGGTNMRAGVVELNMDKHPDLREARVWKSERWRHADDEPARSAAIAELVEMIEGLIARAGKSSMTLAPVIGVACPGIIEAGGAIDRGGQNLPGGNWESEHFNLPKALRKAIPEIAGQPTFVLMHNDAVVQGLSQIPFMQDARHWAVVTIGTGLGNAHFTNRSEPRDGATEAAGKKAA